MNLETPKKFDNIVMQTSFVAEGLLRPIARKYDRAEHEYPQELDALGAAVRDVEATGGLDGVSMSGLGQSTDQGPENRNGSNLAMVLITEAMSKGDVGLLMSMPGQGLGNAAINAVANEEQLARFGGKWAAMAITEPGCGSDSAAIATTAVEDGDDYILNGSKIFVTSGDRCDVVVVWATLDPSLGRAAIKSFVVERDNPGMHLLRLENKLGMRASDTAQFQFDNCRIPKTNLLGSPEIDVKKGFAGVMETFDNTRPIVAAMAVAIGTNALEETRKLFAAEGVEADYNTPPHLQSAAAAELIKMESELDSARLLMLKAAWLADNKIPNSVEASMCKAKAGRLGTEITLRCVQLCGSLGYGEELLIEKWARDAKILDIFEGTQQIQLLIIARRLLGLSSADLK